ncbi:hypothetical protein B0H14DRAFT_1050826 [Mycena olivaceomarginata]|nr:hypothetical protein B0H14DRAFT_1050826 [Mycena olivaceomarginata]
MHFSAGSRRVFYPSKLKVKSGESRRRYLSFRWVLIGAIFLPSPQAGINPAPAPPSPPPEPEPHNDTNNDMGATISSFEVQSFHPDSSFKINTGLLPAQHIAPRQSQSQCEGTQAHAVRARQGQAADIRGDGCGRAVLQREGVRPVQRQQCVPHTAASCGRGQDATAVSEGGERRGV